MNYRDIILKLLKKRASISVIEDFVLNDFSGSEDPKEAFEKWCVQHHIQIERSPGDRSITLSKTHDKND
jgi:hypothetical protein